MDDVRKDRYDSLNVIIDALHLEMYVILLSIYCLIPDGTFATALTVLQLVIHLANALMSLYHTWFESPATSIYRGELPIVVSK